MSKYKCRFGLTEEMSRLKDFLMSKGFEEQYFDVYSHSIFYKRNIVFFYYYNPEEVVWKPYETNSLIRFKETDTPKTIELLAEKKFKEFDKKQAKKLGIPYEKHRENLKINELRNRVFEFIDDSKLYNSQEKFDIVNDIITEAVYYNKIK